MNEVILWEATDSADTHPTVGSRSSLKLIKILNVDLPSTVLPAQIPAGLHTPPLSEHVVFFPAVLSHICLQSSAAYCSAAPAAAAAAAQQPALPPPPSPPPLPLPPLPSSTPFSPPHQLPRQGPITRAITEPVPLCHGWRLPTHETPRVRVSSLDAAE